MYDRVGVLFGAALFMFGVIAGVLGYQRRSVVLILFPLILLVGVQIYLEYVMEGVMKTVTEEFQSFEKLMPKLMSPGSNKFD